MPYVREQLQAVQEWIGGRFGKNEVKRNRLFRYLLVLNLRVLVPISKIERVHETLIDLQIYDVLDMPELFRSVGIWGRMAVAQTVPKASGPPRSLS